MDGPDVGQGVVGDRDGTLVGERVGDRDGILVGERVGDMDGPDVGQGVVGDKDGNFVGPIDGLNVGAPTQVERGQVPV